MYAAATDDAAARRRARARRLRGLYAVTPDLADTADLVARVEAALEGGAAAIQYRNKTADAATRRAQAAALAGAARARAALLVVNDDAALAALVDADGVHLGEDDGSVAAARELLGPDRIVGVSCYDDFARAEAAVAAGADYVAFGSFFPSGVKPRARRASLALLERAAGLGVPVVAIGGIDAATAPVLVAAGADAVAVISAVFGPPDLPGVLRAARALSAASRRAVDGQEPNQ
jgi:thiamine-phosphate pyrophosphorylase